MKIPTGPDRPLCRHCRRKSVNRPKGLCWHCYYDPGVRALYPSTSRHGRKGSGLGPGVRPTRPLVGGPGSAERIACYERRAKLNQWLFEEAG